MNAPSLPPSEPPGTVSDRLCAAARTRGWVRPVRGLVGLLLVLYFLAGATLLVLREVVLPQVDDFRPQIAALIGRAVGLPVDIDALSADWSGLRPRLHLVGLTVRDAAGRQALRLQAVDATLAWSSVLRGMPYFHRLEIRAPDLALRREADGGLFVAGVQVNTGQGEGGVADWLLAQREVVVRGATLTWNDHLRAAPELRLEGVDFRLYRQRGRHRFGLRATPPAALASQIDLRGDLGGVAVDRRHWSGQLYVRLDWTDLGAWRPWIDYPIELAGSGGVQAWIDVDGGRSAAVTADLALDRVTARLGANLPELRLASLRGRLSAGRTERALTVATRALALRTDDGVVVPPTDLELAVERAGDGAATGGRVRLNAVDIAALARLTRHLPVDPSVHRRLAAFDPRGRISDLRLEWLGPVAAPTHWEVHARLEDMGLAARESLPGIGGLDGEIDGDERAGRFRLAGEDAWLDLPSVFPEPRLRFSALRAEGGWQRRDGRPEIVLDSATFENPDASGSASGRYRLAASGPGEIDLSARLQHADGAAVWRYMPLVVNVDTRDWLRHSITGGVVPEARLRLRGDLAHFPFRDGRDGQFLVTARMAGARLDYAAGWPGIDGIDGELRFEGAAMRIRADRGKIFGTALSGVVVEIPDLDAPGGQLLTVRGRVAGPTAEFLRFIDESPVSSRVGRFTAELRAEGAGTLDLRLAMPLHHIDDTRVDGEFRFAGNRIRVVDGLPPVEDAAGRVKFTGDSFAIPEARGKLLDGPLQLTTAQEPGGGLTFHARGAASVAALNRLQHWPLLAQLSGTTPWQADVTVAGDSARVAVRSRLGGIASSLPEPLNKSAAEEWPLEVVVDYPTATRQLIRAKLADRIAVELQRRRSGQDWVVERGGVGVYQPVQAAESGLMVTARLPQLDADAWRRVLDTADGAPAQDGSGAPALPLAGIALHAEQMRVFGQTLNGFDLHATTEGEGWKGRILSREAEGEFTWSSPGEGALKARFRHLALGGGDGAGDDDEGAAAEAPPRHLPGLDVVVDRFALRGVDMGRLELTAKNRDGQWLLDSLALANSDGRLSGSGRWRPGPAPHTWLDFRLESRDVGRLMQRFGYADAVKNGNAQLSGELDWRGAPTRLDYPSLSGKMQLDVGKGQFKKVDPGVGRLLGVLSLQSLPRRITLDFRDVFSEGFAFDRISGSIEVASGVMHTDDLEIRGPAARIAMRGLADIGAETQDLRVLVQPTLAESVAIGAAAGLINPVAGVVTYLAQKALNDPIEKLFAYEYGITGTWADPKVEKLRAPVDKLMPNRSEAPAAAGEKP